MTAKATQGEIRLSLPSSQRRGSEWNWPAGWSRLERLAVLVAWLSPIAVLIVGGRSWGWLAGACILGAAGVLHLVLGRHGGWGLLGPHFYYDVVRLARRGQSIRLRVAYLIALLIALGVAYERAAGRNTWRPNDPAQVSENFTYVLFLVQNIAILVLTPAYLASAITEEKERRTLELLFTTPLTNKEIILGILFARLIHLAGFVLAGLPILCVIQFWGGIDMLLLAGNLANTLLNILTIGSICMLVSTLVKTVAGGVMASYALVLPAGLCLMGTLHGSPFILHDARSAGANYLTVQDLGPLLVVHAVITLLCLALATAALREHEPPWPIMQEWPPLPWPLTSNAIVQPARQPPRSTLKEKEAERLDAFVVPYTLPPVSENALLWKERFLGGPMLDLSVLLVLATPYVTIWLVFLLLSLWLSFLDAEHSFQEALGTWAAVLKFFYYIFLGGFVLAATFRATSSVVRERQQQTLEPLLLLPIDRRGILVAKWLGALWRGWPWLALLTTDAALGMCIGVYHPFSAVLLCLTPWPLLLFFTSLGLLLSVSIRTVLRANLVMVLIMILFIIGMLKSIFGHGGLAGALAYFETFAFSSWLPRERDTQSPERVLCAALIMAGYLCGAWVCWRLAIFLFEKRSQQVED